MVGGVLAATIFSSILLVFVGSPWQQHHGFLDLGGIKIIIKGIAAPLNTSGFLLLVCVCIHAIIVGVSVCVCVCVHPVHLTACTHSHTNAGFFLDDLKRLHHLTVPEVHLAVGVASAGNLHSWPCTTSTAAISAV